MVGEFAASRGALFQGIVPKETSMVKPILILGALLIAVSSSPVMAAGPVNQGLQNGQVFRNRVYNRPRTYTNSLPSTQPRYLAPMGNGPAYQRYSQQPYYMRAERKALGMLP
jgi:hypothetical protein